MALDIVPCLASDTHFCYTHTVTFTIVHYHINGGFRYIAAVWNLSFILFAESDLSNIRTPGTMAQSSFLRPQMTIVCAA